MYTYVILFYLITTIAGPFILLLFLLLQRLHPLVQTLQILLDARQVGLKVGGHLPEKIFTQTIKPEI